jgi:hypothetical protein
MEGSMLRLAKVALLAGAMTLGLTAGASAQADKPLTILESVPGLTFPFFVHMMNQMKAEAEKLGNITVIESDGQVSSPKQTADVEAAITQGVDGIVISPNEVDAMAPALQQAVDANIPVVTIDRRVDQVAGILARDQPVRRLWLDLRDRDRHDIDRRTPQRPRPDERLLLYPADHHWRDHRPRRSLRHVCEVTPPDRLSNAAPIPGHEDWCPFSKQTLFQDWGDRVVSAFRRRAISR